MNYFGERTTPLVKASEVPYGKLLKLTFLLGGWNPEGDTRIVYAIVEKAILHDFYFKCNLVACPDEVYGSDCFGLSWDQIVSWELYPLEDLPLLIICKTVYPIYYNLFKTL